MKKTVSNVKKYQITHEMIAKWFKYTDANSFTNSARKDKILNGIEYLISYIEESIIEKIQKNT